MRFTSHHCGCISCGERLWADDPSVPKRTPVPAGERHVDIHTPSGRRLRGRCRVTIDGRDVTNDCFELVTGTDGWVAVYSPDLDGRRHGCKVCNDHVCSRVERGQVVLEEHARAQA